MGHIDDLFRQLDKKTERGELDILRQDISMKVDKNDYDIFAVSINNQRLENEQKSASIEKDMDEFMETIQNELSNLKNTVLASLNKKADFSMLDRLNDLVSKKVD